MQVTTGKNRRPQSIGYNNLFALRLPLIALAASSVSTTVQSRIPLGVNVKVMAVSYVLDTAVAGTASLNIVQGAASYETAGAPPTGTITLANTFLIGDSVTITVGGIDYKVTVTSRNAGNNQLLSADIAKGINRNNPFGAAYVASSSDSKIYVINIAYATAGNSTTLTTSAVSAAGTATASGGTLAGGSAGTLPTMPALDNSNITSPSQTAAAGAALFPVDMPLNMTADIPSMLYPIYPKNFEAIFPVASEITVRLITNGAAAGNLTIVVWCVPYDVNFMNPEEKNQHFLPGQSDI
jgi:hypothetical protein